MDPWGGEGIRPLGLVAGLSLIRRLSAVLGACLGIRRFADHGLAGARQTPQVRLFAAVWPSPEVLTVLRAFPRDEVPGLRWTTPEQWHVTLGFFGEVPDVERAALWAAIVRAAASVPVAPTATLGTQTELLGKGVLCVEVGGLDVLGAAVNRHATHWISGGSRRFRGHLTLARARRVSGPASGGDRTGPRRSDGREGGSVPSRLVGRPLRPEDQARLVGSDSVGREAGPAWVAGEVCLIASTLGGPGSRYTTVDTVPVGIPGRTRVRK